MNKLRIGIFFGGPSREREVSFAGGRTVYDNLNKSIFEPVPIFVDSNCRFVLLDWQNIYKGSIRDFFPSAGFLPPSPHKFQIYLESLGYLEEVQYDELLRTVGKPVAREDLGSLIDIAFLALHGFFGEDGQIQRLLEGLGIPYTGSGVRPSEIGMDKALQKQLMAESGFPTPNVLVLSREQWVLGGANFFDQAKRDIGFPMVIRPANQGSSIGVSIVDENVSEAKFRQAVNKAFFRELLELKTWKEMPDTAKESYLRRLTDIRDGLGFPMEVYAVTGVQTIVHPEALWQFLDEQGGIPEAAEATIALEGLLSESQVIVESFIHGQEFSCIVVRKQDGSVMALPPTGIIKGKEIFDYRSKYLPGLSRKETPIDLEEEAVEKIRTECERLFRELGFQTYARIDGFITDDRTVFLNDPNTTSGMMPSSFFFHQAAEIGLNPSEFLTYIIRTSLYERSTETAYQSGTIDKMLVRIDQLLQRLRSAASRKSLIGVIMGGYSTERHISVESGRNIFEKLSSSQKYLPIPLFLTGDEASFEIFQIPVNLLLKDNADDIRDAIFSFNTKPIIHRIREQAKELTQKYASHNVVFAPKLIPLDQLGQEINAVFIALHGRPGEDGHLQKELEKRHIPYNGSDSRSSAITIDKFRTLQTLKKNGFTVTEQFILKRGAYAADTKEQLDKIESWLHYPFIAKPVDDGCSSAVKVIKNRKELEAFARLIFRPLGQEAEEARRILDLKSKEEFPRKDEILFESLIKANNAKHFLEITGGLLTHQDAAGNMVYEVFEPSEAVASEGVLSLEEKFLAGEGQNITPARFGNNKVEYDFISNQVKRDLEKAARILNVQGYARIDAFVRIFDDNRAETIIIEVNSLPGMTPATCIFHQAALHNYKPLDFIDEILKYSFLRAGLPYPELVEEATDFQEVREEVIPEILKEPVKEPAEETIPVTESVASEGLTAFFKAEEEENIMQAEPESIFRPALAEPVAEAPFKHKTTFEIGLQNMARFFRSPIFFRNCAVIMGGTILLFTLLVSGLKCYTRHGNSLQVEDFLKMDLKEAKRKASKNGVRLVVTDSIFILDRKPNEIISQTPEAGSFVKSRRKIYVTIAKALADEVLLPELVGSYDFVQYTRKLTRINVFGKIRQKEFDPKQEENTILFFYHGDRKITEDDLKKGIKVPMGSTLEFVVTERNTGLVEAPNFLCLRYSEASFLINNLNLVLGETFGEVEDKNNAFVWKVEPSISPGQMLRMGTKINLYLQLYKPDDCGTEAPKTEELPQEEKNDSVIIDNETTPDTTGGNN